MLWSMRLRPPASNPVYSMEKQILIDSRPDLVVTKWCGLKQTALLARDERAAQRFPEHFLRTARSFDTMLSTEEDRKTALTAGISEDEWLELGSGGILAGLWILCERLRAGMRVNLKDIPLRQETIELANYYDRNPYEMNALGCLLIAAEDGGRLARVMQQNGIEARVIGCLQSGRRRELINGEEIRYLDMPRQTLREMGLWNGKERMPQQK